MYIVRSSYYRECRNIGLVLLCNQQQRQRQAKVCQKSMHGVSERQRSLGMACTCRMQDPPPAVQVSQSQQSLMTCSAKQLPLSLYLCIEAHSFSHLSTI